MANNHVYRSKLHYTLQGNRNIRTLDHQMLTNTSGNSDEQELMDYWVGLAGIAVIAAVQSDNVLWDCIEIQKIFDDGPTKAESSVVNGDPMYKNINIAGGDSINDALPGQCSLLIQSRHISEPMDKHYQGRDFWTGFVETDQDNGEWSVARWDVIGLAIEDATTAPGAVGFTSIMVNWSSTYGKAFNANPAANPLPCAIVSDLRGIKQVRTQRRRQALNPCDQYFDAPVPP